ncbi:MAG TPA: alanine--tRNA ligase-related protein, partial [Blastocatellia bacterium]
MRQTERLYFKDSRILDFSARVVEVRDSVRGREVLLDRTAFYPTGGGQPYDTGKLGGADVIDVYEDEAGLILHLIGENGLIAPGETVACEVDRARRLDHLQQHSGQHILSQAFVQCCGAETSSFHLGTETSTIDIELENPTTGHMRAAEEIANQIIFEDRAMRIHLVSEEDASRMPLRKESAVRGEIRVIEIEGYDWSPCGGTHAASAGQVGLVAIKSFERAKKMTRVEFVCGRRALEEYRRANLAAVSVAQLFSADRDSAPELVARLIQENKELKKRARDLLEKASSAEAADMISGAREAGGIRIVSAIFDDRDLDELRVLASKIVQKEDCIALLGSREGGTARMIFARSAGVDSNMGQLMAEACRDVG